MSEFAVDSFVWVIDLDGVIWLGDDPIAGAGSAVTELQERGATVLFATNNSYPTMADYEDKLARHGIDASGGVVSSALAASRLVEPDETILICGGPGVVEAMSARGVTIVREGPADAVVVGWTPSFDFDMLTKAAQAVHAGARLIGTNSDATLPMAAGLVPGCGSLVAAVVAAGGAAATFAGKPHEPLAAYVSETYGRTGIVIGDRADTDGAFAKTLGFKFALVLSGVTSEADLPVLPTPDIVAPDLATVVHGAGDRIWSSPTGDPNGG